MQAVLPKEMAKSAALVWPVLHEQVGAPIRINGATAWWAWPARAAAKVPGQTVRIFGKNLRIDGDGSKVYLRGPAQQGWLTVVSGNPYALEAKLPGDLDAGVYQVWVHNGTGNRYGWSEPGEFEAAPVPSRAKSPTFHARDFGAIPNDETDDWAALTAAIQAAHTAGGGTVMLAAGTYRLGRALELAGSGPGGIHLTGAAMGSHRWHNAPGENDHQVMHELGAEATVLRPMPGSPPADLVRVSRRFSGIRDLTLLTEPDGGKQRCVLVTGHDVTIERIRGIVVDGRPKFRSWARPESQVAMDEYKASLQDGTVMRIDAPGKANITIADCEFHHPGAGIDTPYLRGIIGHDPTPGPHPLGPDYLTTAPCPPGTDYIRISHCIFRGYFDGRLEPWLRDRRFQGFRGWHNIAWVNNNSKNVIFEGCDIAGADKGNFKVLTRSVNNSNSSIRNVYLANNTGRDLGATSASRGYHENKGEQFIFHLSYPQGGLFDVVAAADRSVTVDPTSPKYAPTGSHPLVELKATEFSVVPGDIEVNPSHWVVFVCAGTGVGQYRVLSGCERRPGRVTLALQTPWRVVPDATSRIVLNAAFRQNIVYNNRLDAGPVIDPVMKTHGVTLWANCFENIVAQNTFSNMSGGVVVNAFYRCPTGWNLIRDNRLFAIQGNGGDTVFPGRAAFYVDHIRVQTPPPGDRVWYTVGNLFRANECRGGDVAAYLHRPDYAHIDVAGRFLPPSTRELLGMPRLDNTVVGYGYPETPEGGIMMSVLENNRFDDVQQGIVISSPLNWALFRNNAIGLISSDAPSIVDEGRRNTPARGVLVIGNSPGGLPSTPAAR